MAEIRDEKVSKLLALLEALGIPYRNHFHEPAFTVEESRHLQDEIPGGHCKSLLLKTKKEDYFLVVMEGDDRLDIKVLSHSLGKGALSFASPENLKALLNIDPGHVTPFAVIYDTDFLVQVIVQEKLLDYELLNYHPLRNDITTTIASQDLIKFLKHHNHEPEIIEVPCK